MQAIEVQGCDDCPGETYSRIRILNRSLVFSGNDQYRFGKLLNSIGVGQGYGADIKRNGNRKLVALQCVGSCYGLAVIGHDQGAVFPELEFGIEIIVGEAWT